MGVPLKDPTGRVIGHIALMDTCSMRNEVLLKTILHHLGCQRANLLFQKPILFRQCKQDSFDRQKFCFSSRL